MLAARLFGPLLLVPALGGCAGASLPDPQEAARAYADAAARGDAAAIHGMLTQASRARLAPAEVAALVAAQKAELAQQAAAIRAPETRVRAEAHVRYGDGERATLALEGGQYRLVAADALPASSRTPTQALEQLRRVLARRSYAALVRLLSPATRAALEADLRSLVTGLEDPEGLDVEVRGDGAMVLVPGGHRVMLRREGGVWYVEDFD